MTWLWCPIERLLGLKPGFKVPINLQRPSVMNGDDTFWYFTIFRAHEPLEHGVIVWIHGFSPVFMARFDSFDPPKIFGAHHETLQAAPSSTCPLRFAGLCRKPLMQCGCLNLSFLWKECPSNPGHGNQNLVRERQLICALHPQGLQVRRIPLGSSHVLCASLS